MTAARRKVTVFGGTGFLGQRVVQHLLERDFSVRVAVRHPERIAALFRDVQLDAIPADVNNDRSVAAAVAGVEGVVNAVSLYGESGPQTFHSVQIEAATRVARLAREAGVRRLIHVSGTGADPGSASPYIRSRGKGEKAVREAFSATTLIRPSIMFGRGDALPDPDSENVASSPRPPAFRTRPDTAATSLCRGRRRCDRQGDAEHPVPDVLGARWAVRLHVQITARSDRPAPRQKAVSGSDAVWPLARARLRCGDDARVAHHAKSGRAHAIG
jgi:hypothetical protein